MNRNTICSIIVKNYYKKKLFNHLQNMQHHINKLNYFINMRTQPLPIGIDKPNWINRTFDELSMLLVNKKVLKEVNDFIKIYNKYYSINITSKKLLSIWLILAFPEFIIDINLEDINVNNQDYKTDLYVLTKELHNMLINLNNNYETMRKFNKQMNIYNNALDVYLITNKKEKVSNYIKEWLDLEKSVQLINISQKYNNDEKTKSINIIEDSKKLIEKYINKFITVPDDFYTKLKDIVVQKINLENTLKQTMDSMLKEELDGGNYDNLTYILEQIKSFILTFTKISNSDIQEQIDIPYIVQMIKHDVLTVKEINDFGYNLLINICSAGSISLETEQIKEWNKIIEEFKTDYKLVISKLLRLSIETISLIIEEIACFKEYLSLVS